MELLPKNTLIVNLLGTLYLVGNDSTLVFEYKSQTFQERNQLIQDKNITHMSFVYINWRNKLPTYYNNTYGQLENAA